MRRRGRRTLLSALGKGLIAGAVGTAVMTAAQLLEMKARRRPPSKTPAKALEQVLGLELEDERRELQLAQAVHFAYGTAWGAAYGLLASRLTAPTAAAGHYLAVVGTALGVLPALGLMSSPREWSRVELALDLAHHAVYVAAVASTYRALDRRW